MANDQTMRLRSQNYNKNIKHRGQVNKKKVDKSRIGPIVLGLMLFLVIGSSIFQMLSIGSKGSGSGML